MKKAFNSFKIAFKTYSKLPVGKIDYTAENMKYTMLFFPLVGLVLGGIFFGIFSLLTYFQVNFVFKSVILTLVPILVTGGFHFDGYIDTIDALSSYQSKERKLEILKDSHVGAFGVIFAIVFLLGYFGALTQIENVKSYVVLSICFVASRSLSGLSVTNFKSAREGSLRMVKDANDRKINNIFLVAYLILAILAIICIDWKLALVVFSCFAFAFIRYKVKAYKNFGGITGDLAGYFLQTAELIVVFGIAIFEAVIKCI
ncbi:MAG: adenosylcobinamide-GDP ribazoletransferase [Clostridia bacterium]